MKTITGTFLTRTAAERALTGLRAFLPAESISYLTPDASEKKVQETSATKDMPPVAAYIGGALGGALGLGLAASVILPGVGMITFAGAAAAALAAALGAAAGSEAGQAVDEAAFRGLKPEELPMYEDALAQGRTIVIVFVRDEVDEAKANAVMNQAGAESLRVAQSA